MEKNRKEKIEICRKFGRGARKFPKIFGKIPKRWPLLYNNCYITLVFCPTYKERLLFITKKLKLLQSRPKGPEILQKYHKKHRKPL